MKYYPPSNHIYYDDSEVAKNKLHIKNIKLIAEIEKEFLIVAYEKLHNQLEESTIFDRDYLCKVHNTIFSAIYEWAGEYRSINIAKGDSVFCPYMNLHNYSDNVFDQLKNDNYLKDYSNPKLRDKFIEKLSYYMCELIVLHPFNEGNGRTIRLFFDMIVTYNGYEYIDYKKTLKKNEYITASIDCMEANCNYMTKIISNGLVKHK